MGGAYNAHATDKECKQTLFGNLRRREYWKDRGIFRGN